jgi:hypothetical protein
VKGASFGGPGLETGELSRDRCSQVDRCRAPGRRGNVCELFGDFCADFKTAGTDTRSESGVGGTLGGVDHLSSQPSDDAGRRSTPTGMSDSDRVVTLENDAKAVCCEHGKWQTRFRRPQGVSFTPDTWLGHPDDGVRMDLGDLGPCLIDAKTLRRGRTSALGVAEVSVGSLAESHPAPPGGSNHPWTKLGMSRVSSPIP